MARRFSRKPLPPIGRVLFWGYGGGRRSRGQAAAAGGKASRAGCNGAAGLSWPFAAVQRGGGRQGAAAAETASKLRRNGVVYFMSYLHRIFYVLSCFVVM